MPIVSVVVATFQRDHVLKKALKSLAEQSYKDFEIVLVDDNEDRQWNRRVENVVDNFLREYSNIDLRYVQNHFNMGVAMARNIGIGMSRGAYVTFLDDDDIYLPLKIERQLSFMLEGNYDYTITDLDLFFENEKLAEHRTRHYIKENSPEHLFTCHMKYHMTGTDTMMFRKQYLVDIGGFPPVNVGDEFYLMHRAINGGGRFGYLPVCDVKAVVHTGDEGLSSGRGKIDGENALFAYKKNLFGQMDPVTIKFIKTRHYASLTYAYLRQGKYLNATVKAARAFLMSPRHSLEIICSRK